MAAGPRDDGIESAADAETAPHPEPDQVAQLPDVLSPEDARRYVAIFELQERRRWKAADREMARLNDRLLAGHVLAERYLHPTGYRSRFRELSAWMRTYSDHPQSKRVYELAKMRRPKSAGYPRRPSAQLFPVYADDNVAVSNYRSPRHRSRSKRRAARRQMWLIKRYARTNRFSLAQRHIASKKVRKLLDSVEIDISYARIGAGWFYYGNARRAYELAGPAARRSGKHFPEGNWIAGLAAFRLGLYQESAGHFEAMARSKWLSSWQKPAAAFWAARANLLSRQPEKVHRWLEAAAKHPRTFYGLLAIRMLGREISFDWGVPDLTPELVKPMLKHRSGRRALALIQIGQIRLAERELRHIAVGRNPRLGPALLAIAEAVGMPALSLRAAGHAAEDDGTPAYGALYPVPDWTPKGGFAIDRALLFAFMRQESGFNARAKSHAGARGLMQLMPATASYIARKRFRGRRRNQLYDPAYNMALGQKYIRYLMRHEAIRGNLLLVAAAYNGGPGNLKKWQRRAQHTHKRDPLMFIETIAAAETRNFVERVLANLWIYRARLGQPAPSLDALAKGERPDYESVDGKTERLAQVPTITIPWYVGSLVPLARQAGALKAIPARRRCGASAGKRGHSTFCARNSDAPVESRPAKS